MQIFDNIILLTETVLRLLTLDGSCTLPAPFDSVTGTCISVTDCTGFSTPGLCPGAADIQCCTDSFAPSSDASTGDVSDLGLRLVESFEGFVDHFYCDVSHRPPSAPRHCGVGEGTLTIGWGHACQPESACNSISEPLSSSDAEALLKSDLNIAVNCVNTKLTASLTQNQFDALVSFVFNLGCGRLTNVAADINSGDLNAATELMKTFNHVGGAVSSVLTRRRAIEVNLFNS